MKQRKLLTKFVFSSSFVYFFIGRDVEIQAVAHLKQSKQKQCYRRTDYKRTEGK